MIRYSLKCRDGHVFDSWFRSAEDFESLRAAGHVACPDCGTAEVAKALMAPQVRPARRKAAAPPEDDAPARPEAHPAPGPGATPAQPPAPAPERAPAGADPSLPAMAQPSGSAGAEGTPGPLAAPASDREAKLAALRRWVERRSDYVGMEFVAEARRMHAGEVPERPIHGEARADEARALIEEGVPVAPLPFVPRRKTN